MSKKVYDASDYGKKFAESLIEYYQLKNSLLMLLQDCFPSFSFIVKEDTIMFQYDGRSNWMTMTPSRWIDFIVYLAELNN